MIFDQLKDSMPPLPPYEGRYRIIYLEPIQLSGERFSVAIMATSANEKKVIQTISHKKLKCMYGKHAPAMQNLITLIVSSASNFLEVSDDLDEWVPPFSGITAGESRKTRYHKDFNNLIYQAVTSFSSLYDGEVVETINQLFEVDEDSTEKANARLITSIKRELGGYHQKNFVKRVDLAKGTTITVDYLGLNFNADISNFALRQLASAETNAKAKLMDMVTLRDEREREKINDNLLVGFLLMAPEGGNDKRQSAIRSIINMANAKNIQVDICKEPKEAAQIIRERDPVIQ